MERVCWMSYSCSVKGQPVVSASLQIFTNTYLAGRYASEMDQSTFEALQVLCYRRYHLRLAARCDVAEFLATG